MSEPTVHYVVDAPNTEVAVFELALRVGMPFVLHRSASSVPRSAFVAQLAAADVARAASLLTYEHEQHLGDPQRDALGRVAPEHAPLGAELFDPPLERIAENVVLQLASQGVPIEARRHPWGAGKYAMVLTHDVDGPRLLIAFALARAAFLGILRGNRHELDSALDGAGALLFGKRRDPYWNFDAWRELARELGAKSAFYFYCGPTPAAGRHARDPRYDIAKPRFAKLLRQLAAEDWETGVHFGIHADSAQALAEARERLTKISGRAALGGRAHYWALDWRDMLGAWQRIERAGFTYDTSVSPQRVGWRGGTMLPTTPSAFWRGFDGEPFVVMPTALMDAYLVKFTSFDQATQSARVAAVLERVRKPGGLLVLDWHVRAGHNQGAFTGFMDALWPVIAAARNDSACRWLGPAEAAAEWRAHVRTLFRGIEG